MELDLNLYDTHDRNDYFIKQHFGIEECIDSLMKQRPFFHHPFYAYAHSRTHEDGPHKKRLIWQPRLKKPYPTPNTMLFKLYPDTGEVKTMWVLPDDRIWEQFAPRMISYHETIWISIQNYRHHRLELSKPEPDDLTEEEIAKVYRELSHIARQNKKKKNATSEILKAYDSLDSETKKQDGLVCFEPPSRNSV